MKRKLFIAAIVCLTFLTLLMVSGCKMVYLNSSRLEMIAAVNERAFAKDAEILEDIGVIRGATVALMRSSSFISVKTEEEICDKTFTYYPFELIAVYKDGKVCTLSEAYRRGTVSESDVDIVYYRYIQKKERPLAEECMNISDPRYFPIQMTPEEEEKARESIRTKARNEGRYSSSLDGDFDVEKRIGGDFLGSYDGYPVFAMFNLFNEYDIMVKDIFIRTYTSIIVVCTEDGDFQVTHYQPGGDYLSREALKGIQYMLRLSYLVDGKYIRQKIDMTEEQYQIEMEWEQENVKIHTYGSNKIVLSEEKTEEIRNIIRADKEISKWIYLKYDFNVEDVLFDYIYIKEKEDLLINYSRCVYYDEATDCVIYLVLGGAKLELTYLEIGGRGFPFFSGITGYMFKDGNIYTLKEADEAGLITDEMLEVIDENIKQVFVMNNMQYRKCDAAEYYFALKYFYAEENYD